MTPQEFRKRIAESGQRDWFNSTSKSIVLPHIGSTISYNIPALFDYIDKQIITWKEIEVQNIPSELRYSVDYYMGIKTSLEQLLSLNATQLNSALPPIKLTNPQSRYIFPLDHPVTTFLLNTHRDDNTRKYYKGAFQYITGTLTAQTLTNRDIFTGCIMAYEFLSKDISHMVVRKDSEKRTLNQLNDSYAKKMSDLHAEAIRAIADSEAKSKEYTKVIDELKSIKEKDFTKWFDGTRTDHGSFHSDCVSKVKDLEETYKEKLKLEAPAKYWDERAVELRKQGWWAFWGLLGLVIIAAASLFALLIIAPNSLLESIFGDNIGTAIKWTIVYATFITFMAYGIRAVSKVMFSSFHLARDCEERKTLTYFYLSLIKDSTVSDLDRQLIMQSLFSRAETGLLKDDSSPTMPTDKIISTVLEKGR